MIDTSKVSRIQEVQLIHYENFKKKQRQIYLSKEPVIEGTKDILETFKKEDSRYEYVDLGLPSGTLWAKWNVGATSETDTGLYFAWGETQGYTADQVGTGEGLYVGRL